MTSSEEWEMLCKHEHIFKKTSAISLLPHFWLHVVQPHAAVNVFEMAAKPPGHSES
jgi:hypothetical protein